MSMLPEIDPRQILDAFSNRKVLVSMSDGPASHLDSRGETYQELMQDNGDLTAYLDALVASAGDYDNVLIEWRVWPEHTATGIYSRFTIRPNVPVN